MLLALRCRSPVFRSRDSARRAVAPRVDSVHYGTIVKFRFNPTRRGCLHENFFSDAACLVSFRSRRGERIGANFAVLTENPVTCEPMRIRSIGVWGTVHEGRVLPISQAPANQAVHGPITAPDLELARIRALNSSHLLAQRQRGGLLGDFLVSARPGSMNLTSEGRTCTCGSPLIHAMFSELKSTPRSGP